VNVRKSECFCVRQSSLAWLLSVLELFNIFGRRLCLLRGGTRSLIGGFVIVLSVILIGVSVWFFKKAGTPVRPVSPPTTIVRSGPYRFSRNPMYVSMPGILVGLSICLGSLLFLVALVAALAIVQFGTVMPEERYLEALHGEAYRRYKMSVRRWRIMA
jgi:protein-S-isoprenylcysteine O-methyltransferase Ste14